MERKHGHVYVFSKGIIMDTPQAPSGSALLNPLQPIHELLQSGNPEAVCAKYGISPSDLGKLLDAYQKATSQAVLGDDLTFCKAGRNDPCPCGSGKKYKKCCLARHEEARKTLPANRLQDLEEQARRRERLEKDIQKGFDLLFSREYGKASNLAASLLDSYPEDDRLHDISVTSAMATGDYDKAFNESRRRWQVAQEEKAFYLEKGFHQREGEDREQLVHFYSPSTWLFKLWVAQQAREYRKRFPTMEGSPQGKTAARLLEANDTRRFPAREEEGLQIRRQALDPVLRELEREGPAAIAYLLPLTYSFSWASLFVPDLLRSYGTDESLRLLGELSLFRFPYFAQNCLANLESFGERAVPHILSILREKPVFDELKSGLILVLGAIQTAESFDFLMQLIEHENPNVVNWAVQALERHQRPEALPLLERAREKLGARSEIAGAIKDLSGS